MRWNKRPRQERMRIMQQTLRSLEKTAEKLMLFPDEIDEGTLDRFYNDAMQAQMRLRSSGTNAQREKLARILASVAT